MSVEKRNPFATAHDFMGGVRTSFEISRDNDRPAEDRPIRITFSVGTGRGNSKPEMAGVQFEELVGFLCDGNAVELNMGNVLNDQYLGPAEHAARTLTMGDGTVEFKVSSQSGARTIKVPAGQWGSFVEFLTVARNAIPAERDLIWPMVPEKVDPPAEGADVHVEDENA